MLRRRKGAVAESVPAFSIKWIDPTLKAVITKS